MITLAYARSQLYRVAANGVAPTDPRVDARINEAAERLFSRTDFKYKTARYAFCARQACITLPPGLETALGANVNAVHHNIRNQWFEFMENGPGEQTINGCAISALVDRGDGWPSFHDVCGEKKLRVYADLPEDADAQILLQGKDENSNLIMTSDGAGGWVDGEYVAIDNATPATSVKWFTKLVRIQKPVTNGFVRIYQVIPDGQAIPAVYETIGTTLNAVLDHTDVIPIPSTGPVIPLEAGDVLRIAGGTYTVVTASTPNVTPPFQFINALTPDFVGVSDGDTVERLVSVATTADIQSLIAIMGPDETVPSLRRYIIPGISTTEDTDVVILCQRRWMPVSRASDIVYPSNIGALKLMILALEKEEKNLFNESTKLEEKAVSILRDELRQFHGPQGSMIQIQMVGFGQSWLQLR